jgi:hypothetical protein
MYETTGSTSVLTTVKTIPNGDGESVYGTPIASKAKLIQWGVLALATKYIAQLQLSTLDQTDPINGENINIGGNSLMNMLFKYTQLNYVKGQRNINLLQTATGNSIAWTVDWYDANFPSISSKEFGVQDKNLLISLLVTGALTINIWNQIIVAQAATGTFLTPIPNGKYAILGAWVSNIASTCLLRFKHADFGAYRPGFPVFNFLDQATVLHTTVQPEDDLIGKQGYQFAVWEKLIGKPCCPVFTVNNNATGLIVEFISNTASEEPLISLNLVKVG